jgi:hypothetical protein
MTDDFPNQLRKQFSIDRVLENPGFVAAVYVNERDHAADIIEDQQKRIEQLEAALREISHIHDGNPSAAMAGMPDIDYARFVLGEARRVARAALEGKKDV